MADEPTLRGVTAPALNHPPEHTDAYPSPAPSSPPATTSLRKCMPSRIREHATLTAQNSSSAQHRRIERAQRDRDRERRDGVSRREGELIRRQQRGPAMRLQRAGALAPAGSLQFEERARCRRLPPVAAASSARKRSGPAEQRHHRADAVPQPAIAAAGRRHHPQAHPARRPPAVHAGASGGDRRRDRASVITEVCHVIFLEPWYNSRMTLL